MILKARNGWWRQLLDESDGNTVIEDAIRHGNSERFTEIDSDAISKEDLTTFKDVAES